QAEDGIRDFHVTGVQTCALPISGNGCESELAENKMIVCEFCLNYSEAGTCRLGLNIPKGMKCREFAPGIEKFCANPEDFVSARQIGRASCRERVWVSGRDEV